MAYEKYILLCVVLISAIFHFEAFSSHILHPKQNRINSITKKDSAFEFDRYYNLMNGRNAPYVCVKKDVSNIAHNVYKYSSVQCSDDSDKETSTAQLSKANSRPAKNKDDVKSEKCKSKKAKQEPLNVNFFEATFILNIASYKKIFDAAASLGNSEAHAYLGLMYASGIGVDASQAHAVIHLTYGAIGNNSLAQMALGYRYLMGINVKPSCEKSLELYRAVSAKVIAEHKNFYDNTKIHQIRLFDEEDNLVINDGSHEGDLIDYYHLMSERGDTSAQVQMGQLYYRGNNKVQASVLKAIYYFQKASYAGNVDADAFLGRIYLQGYGNVKPNHQMALEYLWRAVIQNNSMAQFYLGISYLHGNGIPKNMNKAISYMMLSAEQGYVDALVQLGILHMSGAGLKRSFSRAATYFTLAAQVDNLFASYYLGLINDQGLGLKPSCSVAVALFKKVAERGSWNKYLTYAYDNYHKGNKETAFLQYAIMAEVGYEAAQSNAAFLLGKLDILPLESQDVDLYAIKYWRRAAAQGNPHARLKLGDFYFYGIKVEVDYDNAANQYKLAWDQHRNAQAMFNLGYMYEHGYGSRYDLNLARRCYYLAAESDANAVIPVFLALIKLNIHVLINFVMSLFYVEASDIYIYLDNLDILIIALLASFYLVVFIRRV